MGWYVAILDEFGERIAAGSPATLGVANLAYTWILMSGNIDFSDDVALVGNCCAAAASSSASRQEFSTRRSHGRAAPLSRLACGVAVGAAGRISCFGSNADILQGPRLYLSRGNWLGQRGGWCICARLRHVFSGYLSRHWLSGYAQARNLQRSRKACDIILVYRCID